MSYVYAKLHNHKFYRLGVRWVLVLRRAAGTAFRQILDEAGTVNSRKPVPVENNR